MFCKYLDKVITNEEVIFCGDFIDSVRSDIWGWESHERVDWAVGKGLKLINTCFTRGVFRTHSTIYDGAFLRG